MSRAHQRGGAQLDFLDVLTPRAPHRWQTVAEVEDLGRAAAARAHATHAEGPAYSDRAADQAFVAMILFGAARIIEQRQERDRASR